MATKVIFTITATSAQSAAFLASNPQQQHPWTPQSSREFALQLKSFCADRQLEQALRHNATILEPWFDEFVWRAPMKLDLAANNAAQQQPPQQQSVRRPRHFFIKVTLANFPDDVIEVAVAELVPDQVDVVWGPPPEHDPPPVPPPAIGYSPDTWADARAFVLRGGMTSMPMLQLSAVNAACAAAAATLKANDTIAAIKGSFLLPYTLTAPFPHLRRPRGVLLWGPPGTAKSQLAQLLFENSGIRCIWKGSAPELNRTYVGQTEQELKHFARDAASTPQCLCALIIDELDSLCRSRASSSSGNQQEHKADVLNTILGLIGGLSDVPNLVLIGCTNFKSALDQAVLRAGRVDQHYFMGCLKGQLRHDFLQSLLNLTTPHVPPADAAAMNAQLADMVKHTSGLTGAQIRVLVSSWTFAILSNPNPNPVAAMWHEQLRQFFAHADGLTYQKLANLQPPLPVNQLNRLLPVGAQLLAPYVYNPRQRTLYARIGRANRPPLPVQLKLPPMSSVDVIRCIVDMEPAIEFVRVLDEQLASDLVIRGNQGISERVKATFDEFEEYAHQNLATIVAVDIDSITGCNEDISSCEQSAASSVKISTGAGWNASLPLVGGPSKAFAHELVPDATTSDSASETVSFRIQRPEFLDLILSTLRAQNEHTRSFLRTFICTEFQQMSHLLQNRIPSLRSPGDADAICDGSVVLLSLQSRNGLCLAPGDSSTLHLVPLRSEFSQWIVEDGSRDYYNPTIAHRHVSLRHVATQQYLSVSLAGGVKLSPTRSMVELVGVGARLASGSRVRITAGADYVTAQEFGLELKAAAYSPKTPYTNQSIFILRAVENSLHL